MATERNRIFISYRRSDSAGTTTAIRKTLVERFEDQVFHDVAGRRPTTQLHQVRQERLERDLALGAREVRIAVRQDLLEVGEPRIAIVDAERLRELDVGVRDLDTFANGLGDGGGVALLEVRGDVVARRSFLGALHRVISIRLGVDPQHTRRTRSRHREVP